MRTTFPSLARIASVAILAACHDSSAPAAESSTNRGVIISANAPSAHQQETTLAQSASGRIVVAWIGWVKDTGAVTAIEYTISDDRGSTWTTPKQIPIPGSAFGMSDPALAVDAAGNFTLAAMTVGPTGVNIYRMAAGGSSFGDPVTLATNKQTGVSFDKTWIVQTASGLMATVTGIRGKDTVGVV